MQKNIICILFCFFLNNKISTTNPNSKVNAKAKAIFFRTYFLNGKRKLVDCPNCKHFDPANKKCKLFSINSYLCRTNQSKCGYEAKYFEPDNFESNINKIVDIINYNILLATRFNLNEFLLGLSFITFLRENGYTHLFVCGLAYDFCVGNTALDLAKEGFLVYLVADGTRYVGQSDSNDIVNISKLVNSVNFEFDDNTVFTTGQDNENFKGPDGEYFRWANNMTLQLVKLGVIFTTSEEIDLVCETYGIVKDEIVNLSKALPTIGELREKGDCDI